MLERVKPKSDQPAEHFFAQLNSQLRATIYKVERLTPNIIEVVVHAPMAAEHFQPGQFYRFQNYATLATVTRDTRLAMEGLALTGASVDIERGLVSLIVLEMGGSSNLCALLKPGEPVVLMGPTGTPTEIPSGKTVVLVGGGLGNAVLFSIGAAARAAGSKVLYFAGYKSSLIAIRWLKLKRQRISSYGAVTNLQALKQRVRRIKAMWVISYNPWLLMAAVN